MEFTLDNGQRDLLWLVLAPAAPALCSQIGHGMPQWAIILASIISCWILLATAYTETNRLWKDSSRVRNCQHQTIIRAWTVLLSVLAVTITLVLAAALYNSFLPTNTQTFIIFSSISVIGMMAFFAHYYFYQAWIPEKRVSLKEIAATHGIERYTSNHNKTKEDLQ